MQTSPTPPKSAPKLLDRVRQTLRTNRYSPHTESAYVDWIKRYIRFHGVRHPQEMGAEEVKAFLRHLATEMTLRPPRKIRRSRPSCFCRESHDMIGSVDRNG